MTQLPDNLDHAIDQALAAVDAAIADGQTRIQVELLFPEMRIMPLAQRFITHFDSWGETLRVFFPDPGAAALARRDWGEKPYAIRGIGELKATIQEHERLFLFVEPSSVEVQQVEALCNEAGDRPVVLFLPRLEDVATIGIGYAGRQLRERFLNQFESCYYLRPLDSAAILRAYPSPWQVWTETEAGYELATEQASRPTSEQLEQLLFPTSAEQPGESAPVAARRGGVLGGLKQFLRALSQ